MKKNGKFCKRLLIVCVGIYVLFTLVNQQKTLNQYSKNSDELKTEIEEQKEYQEELSKKKEDVDTPEFIEQTAREKLKMYYPNEKVYIDNGM